MLVGNDVGQSL